MIYLELFFAFFKVGSFGFGGGHGMLSLIQNEVVINYQWLSTAEFSNVIAISQIAPGPLSLNCATYIGYNVVGNALGAFAALMGLCTPSIVLMLLAAHFYKMLKGNRYLIHILRVVRPIVIGLIFAAAVMLARDGAFDDYIGYIIFAISLGMLCLKANPILAMLVSGAIGYFCY